MRKAGKMVCIVMALVFAAALFAACTDKNDTPSASVAPIETTPSEPVPTPTPTPTPTLDPNAVPTPDPNASASPDPNASASPDPEASASASASSGAATVFKIEMSDEDTASGDGITQVQERLEELGYLDQVTGYFGTDTEAAVKEFQANNDLDDDGIVGAGTLEVLESEDAVGA